MLKVIMVKAVNTIEINLKLLKDMPLNPDRLDNIKV